VKPYPGLAGKARLAADEYQQRRTPMTTHTANPPSTRAVVLLSGGLDSVAALCWAHHRYPELRAMSFDYGQPNRDSEVYSAQSAAQSLGVPWQIVGLSDAMRPERPLGLLAGVHDHDADADRFGGTSRAFVPGRNLIFVSVAFAHAASWWTGGSFHVVIGACADDQPGFPDCRPTVLDQLAATLRSGGGRSLAIHAPWAKSTKAQILYAIKPDARALELVQRSYSCYRKDGPCGRCEACAKRAVAFADQGIEDRSAGVTMRGGDPQRERR
jgi:7-cyano-7-deazaguanine synthase